MTDYDEGNIKYIKERLADYLEEVDAGNTDEEGYIQYCIGYVAAFTEIYAIDADQAVEIIEYVKDLVGKR